MNLPEYKMIGRPRRIRAKGVLVANHYQFYRLPPDLKVKRAPCCRDRQQSERKAIYYVEQHIKKGMAKDDPIVACAAHTIEQHLTTYRESLEADERCREHVTQTASRIRKVCKALGWKTIPQVDGLKLKHWLSKQKNLAHKTRKYYASSFRSFTKFLAENRRIEHDPLAYYSSKVKGDDPKPSKIRRALTPDELNRIVRAARASAVREEALTGEQRSWLYLVAASTGFRAGELSSLTPRSFDLDEAIVMLERQVSKRRTYDKQELPPSLVEGLRGWLADKPQDARLWPSFWKNRAARMLRADMRVAGVDPVDSEGRVADFHALRVTYITNLVGHGTQDLVLVQRLARLSTVALLNRYAKPHNEQRRAAVAKLPELEVPVG